MKAPTPAPGWGRLVLEWAGDSVRRFGWAPIVVMGTHLVLSKLTRVYAVAPNTDVAMHFVGGVAIAFFFWRSVRSALGGRILGPLTLFGQAVVAMALSCSSTVLWEFAEWTTDRLGLTQAQSGLPDTMLDMALGTLGGLIFLCTARLAGAKGEATD